MSSAIGSLAVALAAPAAAAPGLVLAASPQPGLTSPDPSTPQPGLTSQAPAAPPAVPAPAEPEGGYAVPNLPYPVAPITDNEVGDGGGDSGYVSPDSSSGGHSSISREENVPSTNPAPTWHAPTPVKPVTPVIPADPHVVRVGDFQTGQPGWMPDNVKNSINVNSAIAEADVENGWRSIGVPTDSAQRMAAAGLGAGLAGAALGGAVAGAPFAAGGAVVGGVLGAGAGNIPAPLVGTPAGAAAGAGIGAAVAGLPAAAVGAAIGGAAGAVVGTLYGAGDHESDPAKLPPLPVPPAPQLPSLPAIQLPGVGPAAPRR
ncbi:hypothetical protein FOS14_23510 [Skermania sp. ID1734]|nr:hypothetical protein FOS14_23510 [Skermania sp. ID1734]